MISGIACYEVNPAATELDAAQQTAVYAATGTWTRSSPSLSTTGPNRQSPSASRRRPPQSHLVILDDEYSSASIRVQLWEISMIEFESMSTLLNFVVEHDGGVRHDFDLASTRGAIGQGHV